MICLYGCWNCCRPAAIVASSFGRNLSIRAGFGPETVRPRFFSSAFRSVTFISSILLRSDVALLTSWGVSRRLPRLGVEALGVVALGVPGTEEAGEGTDEEA